AASRPGDLRRLFPAGLDAGPPADADRPLRKCGPGPVVDGGHRHHGQSGADRHTRTGSRSPTSHAGESRLRRLPWPDDVVARFTDAGALPAIVQTAAALDPLRRGLVLLALPRTSADRRLASGRSRRGGGALDVQAGL